MNIKTLSQITPLPLGEKIHISSYVGVSQYSPVNDDNGKYSSRKVTYGQLSS